MRDGARIAICVALGLALAYLAGRPLYHPGAADAGEKGSVTAPGGGRAQIYAAGTVRLNPAVHPKGHVLFLILRAPEMPRPIAVQRIEAPQFPFSFELTTSNNMIGGDFYPGDLRLTARIDADGVAGPATPDDIESSIDVPAHGSRQVDLTIGPAS